MIAFVDFDSSNCDRKGQSYSVKYYLFIFFTVNIFLRLTVKILSFLRLTAIFLAVLRRTVNPIEALL